ncbi:IS3 family transposase, partial [Aquicoccus porphyridii]|uniref:IS3 family transposase n=1 Tax=Aquicoccus porphyridii TaxID=1852029 RepID=UPI00273D0C7D
KASRLRLKGNATPGLAAKPLPCLFRSGSRHSVILLFRCHRPNHAGHLVCQCHCRHHPWFARNQVGEPAIGAAALAHDPADHAHCADNQEFADVALPHLADSSGSIRRRTYRTREEARRDVFEYIEMFYNPKRKHARNGMLSPVNFEQQQKLRHEGV